MNNGVVNRPAGAGGSDSEGDRHPGLTGAWDEAAEDYRTLWLPLNRPLLEQAVRRLPDLPPGATIHLPGAGPGPEVTQLRDRYPEAAALVASDLAPRMVAAGRARQESDVPRDPDNARPCVHWICEDVHAPAVIDTDLSVSFFVLHLIRDGAAAVRKLWSHVRPGGALAALYFPPLPGPGPLRALYRASHRLKPRNPSPWENRALEFLREHAARVVRKELRARWTFDSPGAFRRTMEVLPHIRGIRDRAGASFYEQLWTECLRDPELEPAAEGWQGPVTAIYLCAHKPE